MINVTEQQLAFCLCRFLLGHTSCCAEGGKNHLADGAVRNSRHSSPPPVVVSSRQRRFSGLGLALLHPGGCVAPTNTDHNHGSVRDVGSRWMSDGMNQDATPEAARAPVAELQTLTRTKLCMQTRREEPGMAKTNKSSLTQGQHTHTQPRQKQTRWKSVSTKPRQADTTNQANSNDFPALLPYKGKGTPSAKFSCCCLCIFWARIPCGARLVRCGQLWSCSPALLSVASRPHWPGLQCSFRVPTRWREGAQCLRTAPFQHSHRQRK